MSDVTGLNALILKEDEIKWNTLKEKIIQNNTVIMVIFIYLVMDLNLWPKIYMFIIVTKISFITGPNFMAENLYVYYCDKNFVYYWIGKHTFPNVKDLSHPCKPQVLYRDFEHFYLGDAYYRCYKDRWAANCDNIVEEINRYKAERRIDIQLKE
jgi:hypothetical protein